MFDVTAVMVDGVRYATLDAAATAIGDALNKQVDEGMSAVQRTLRRTMDDVYSRLARQHGGSWPTGTGPWGTSPDRLASRSGAGLRSIKGSIYDNIVGDVATAGISTAGLTVHETGATIRAKKPGGYLTIPFRAALDARGLPLRRRARDWDNTFVARSKRGNLIIFRKQGNGTIIPLYLLKNSTYVPRRLGMAKTFEEQVPIAYARVINDFEAAL
jgi:hypothetical protein